MNLREQDIEDKSQSLLTTFDSLIKDPSIPSDQKLNVIIHLTALTCALVAVQPIPFADLFILSPIQVVMVMGMSRVLGNPLGKHGAAEIIASVVGVVGWGVLAQQVVLGLYKTLIPFMGAVTTIPMVYGATTALGYAAKAILEARTKDQEISQQELKKLQEQAQQRAKQENINLETIQQQLSQWRAKAEAYQKYQAELEQQQLKIDELQKQQDQIIADFEKKLVSLHSKIKEKNHSLEVLEQDLKNQNTIETQEFLQQQIIYLKQEIDCYLEENTELEQQLNLVKTDYNQLHNKLEEKSQQAAKLAEQLEQLTQKRITSLTARIKTCYPNLIVLPEVLKAMAKLNNDDIYAVERQFGLLQHDLSKVSFKCTIQGTRKKIQEIQINSLRLYVSIEGNRITIIRVGKKSEQATDIEWLKNHGFKF